MSGRRLNDSFVILDEAQNATKEKMKMFLTRIGFSSKAVITGKTSPKLICPNIQSPVYETLFPYCGTLMRIQYFFQIK